MTFSGAAETERVIRQKLEASGQYGKMRAMIMEAALQTMQSAPGSNEISSNSSSNGKDIFAPSVALAEAKKNGLTELSVVFEYLHFLGLQYTESVLRLEAGLTAVPLQSSSELKEQFGVTAPGPCLSALVHGAVQAGGKVADGSASPSIQPTAALVGEPADDAASDHDQPGGEDTTYFISNWKQRHFVRCQQVTGQQVQLDRLTDCQTVVLDELDSMTADDCEGGELVIAACEGSVFLRNCKNMTVHVACKQLRTRDCENIDLYIFTTTDPVVEMSHHINFYPFHLRLPGLQRLFAEARLDPKLNRFVHVYDFTPSEPGLPQPHFQVHFPDHGQSMEDRCAKFGSPECPPELEQLLALQLMPAASSESGKNKSYDIRTGAQVWATTGVAAAATAAATAVPIAAATAPAAGSNTTTAAAYKDDFDESASEERSSVHSSSVSDVASDSSSDSGSNECDRAERGGIDDNNAASTVRKRAAVDTIAAPATVPMPAGTTTRTTTAATDAGHAATPGAMDSEEYSSFDDESDAHNADDKYDVDEDEDDF